MYYLLEAIIVGIIVVILGTIISKIFQLLLKTEVPIVCNDWNKYHIMEISLFMTGFATHLVCEILGMNKWYCRNGYACKN